MNPALLRLVPFKSRIRPLWHYVSSIPHRRDIRRRVTTDRTNPRVFYGHDYIPGAGDLASGGIVKFQRLQPVFPNTPVGFNVLYMVSSNSPKAAAHVARAAAQGGARIAWNQNGVAYPGYYGSGWQRVNRPMRAILAMADHVFYQSEFCKKSAAEFLGTESGTSEILYNCVDTQFFCPAPDQSTGRPLTLLLGGTQYQYYRLETAVKALAEVRGKGVDARLLVSGRLCWQDEPTSTREAMQLINRLCLEKHVSLLGPYRQQDAPDVYRAADILLHTKYNDPCPGVVVEGMACGLPVVYSASGGVPELVGGDAGVGVEAECRWDVDIPPDPGALAEAVVKVSGQLEGYASAARRRAEAIFGIDDWIQRHIDVFHAFLGNPA